MGSASISKRDKRETELVRLSEQLPAFSPLFWAWRTFKRVGHTPDSDSHPAVNCALAQVTMKYETPQTNSSSKNRIWKFRILDVPPLFFLGFHVLGKTPNQSTLKGSAVQVT